MKVKRKPLIIRANIVKKDGESFEELELQKNEDMYEEYAHMLENIKGDGGATVSVELEFSDKNFGKGVSVRVFCSLTCNQDLQAVETGYSYASQIAQDQLETSIPEVKKLYERFISES